MLLIVQHTYMRLVTKRAFGCLTSTIYFVETRASTVNELRVSISRSARLHLSLSGSISPAEHEARRRVSDPQSLGTKLALHFWIFPFRFDPFTDHHLSSSPGLLLTPLHALRDLIFRLIPSTVPHSPVGLISHLIPVRADTFAKFVAQMCRDLGN